MKTLLGLFSFIFFLTVNCFPHDSATYVFHINKLPAEGMLLDKGWKFHAGDNPEWAKPEFDDSNWQDINPTYDFYYLPQIRKEPIGWFRVKLHVDSSLLNKPLAFQVYQSIASEIYLNGNFKMEQEAAITRKMLERVPADKFSWKPHEKSMTMQQLTVHIAELPSWVKMALTTSELDFSKMDYTPTPVSNTSDLLSIFEKSFSEGKEALNEAKEENLLPDWTLRNGEQVYSIMTKYEVIRHSFAQTIHHRAQLGVYLRLLNIPIPGSYGPSADEMNF